MAAYGGGGGGGGGGGADGDKISMTMAYEDVEWERDGRGNPVIIGRGAFGTVYAGALHGQPVAIKAETLEAGEEEAWLKAVRHQKGATSPHIVAVHGIIIDRYGGKVTHHVVMERLAGTMTALLLKPDGAHYKAELELRLQLLADVVGGLAYLHSTSVIHADVKPDNVLLSAPTRRAPLPTAKLSDFGSSVHRRAGTRTRGTLRGERGTLVYMDPVLLDSSGSITAASDVYSFGIMAWQVLTGLTPYEADIVGAAPTSALEAERMLRAHVCGPRGKRPPLTALAEWGVPPAVASLVASCWAPEQAARPAMAAVQRALETAAARAPVPVGGAAGDRGGAVPTAPPAAPVVMPLPAFAALLARLAPEPTPPRAPAVVAPLASALAYEWDDALVLRGHTNWVQSLSLLSGGQLASGDRDGVVRLWDAARGGEATTVLEGHGGEVRALAALPDGRRLAAGVWAGDGKAGSIVVWDTSVVPGKRCATVGCGSGVCALVVLQDGRLAAGCHDGGVRLVEVGASAGVVTATLKGHTRAVAALAVLTDGTLASGSADATVRLWDVGAAACVATVAGDAGGIFVLAVLSDGRLASGASDKCVRLWDVATRACVSVLKGHTDHVCALAALPDGRLASGSIDRTIRVWDTRPAAAAGAPLMALEGHTHVARALQPLPGGRLASGSYDETVRLWRVPP